MKEKINVIVFSAILFMAFILIFFVPADQRTVETENRQLQSMPQLTAKTIFNGSFSKDFESFISDRFGFRSYLIPLSSVIKSWEGIVFEDEAVIVIPANSTELAMATVLPTESPGTPSPEAVLTRSPAPSSTPEPVQTENTAAAVAPNVDIEIDLPEFPENPTAPPEEEIAPIKAGPVLKFKDKIVEIYGFNKNNVQHYCDTINAYRQSLGDNVRVFSAVMPTQIEFIDEKYKSVTDSQRKSMDYIIENLDEGVIFVDAYDELKRHSKEYIYFRTDHHWTALGAYYAYTAFAEEAGFEALDLDTDFDKHVLENFIGLLYSYSPTDYLAEHPDYIEYYTFKEPIETTKKLWYLPGENGKTTYSLFIGGDQAYLNIQTATTNGDTVIVVKDSFANAFIPYLAAHYENIIVIDPRKYTGSITAEIAKYENVDLVFFDYIFATGMHDFVSKISSIK